MVPEVQAGLGGMNMKFYVSSRTALLWAAEFQHFLPERQPFSYMSARVSFFLSATSMCGRNSLHYVNNLTQQFNSNWVPQYGVMVGYRFGD